MATDQPPRQHATAPPLIVRVAVLLVGGALIVLAILS
jgi:hypothetical protein